MGTDEKKNHFWIKTEDIPEEGLTLESKKKPSFLKIESDSFMSVQKAFDIKCTAKKASDSIFISGKVSGPIGLQCGRCLEWFEFPLLSEFEGTFLPKNIYHEDTENGEEPVNSQDNIYPYRGDRIDILPAVRDQILLSVPIRPTCQKSCHGLCSTCGINLNQNQCDCHNICINPQFEALKDLKKRLT